ncbi:MAG: hypothetical protein EOO06_12880 [Chitinophagaceae bacterium]|nr:MAG: hypothetical protein EOO06_12880 [Chitinophagaceae bacterium]
MKRSFNILIAAAAVVLGMMSCDKADELSTFGAGKAPVLSASATAIAALPADSNNTVQTFTWTYPDYATDSGNIKYSIEIDSATKNFSSPLRKTVTAEQTLSFTAKELNAFLVNRLYAFNVPVSLEARVISSYANNNERLVSNTVAFKVTPYKVPPKVGFPAGNKLWANGAALPWSWTGAPPTPQSEFSRLNEETWGGVFNFNANEQFLVLSQNGGSNPYDQKYGVASNQVPDITSGGAFGYYPPGTGGDNFKSPASGGWYKMIMDFQSGLFTISNFGNPLPQELYILGDATTGGWNNAPPAPQKFTRINSVEYELTIALTPGKYYKFISNYGNWQPQFGGNSATGTTLSANYGSSSDPDAVPTPAAAGNYKINVNFASNTYKVTPA